MPHARSLMRSWPVLGLVLVLLLGAIGCRTRLAPAPTSWHAWRERRSVDIAGPDGWASIAGLFWLQEGEQWVGARGDVPVKLPMGSAPNVVGTFRLERGTVRFTPVPGVRVMLRGYAVTAEKELATDVDGAPDILEVGRVKFWILHRGDRRGVRVRDPEAPERINFKEIPVFTYHPAYRVTARFEPYTPPRTLQVADVTGGSNEETCPGALVFQLHEQEVRLDVIDDPEANDFFLLFRDATSGKETYGGGRFLHVRRPNDAGEVDIDFNLAYSPPCAFTAFATCPVPPRQNWLPVPIKAGERKPHR